MFKQRFPLWDENNGDGNDSGGSGGSNNAEMDSLKDEVQRLKNHNAKLLDEKKQVQASLKKFDGIDPDNIKKMMKVLESSEEAKLLADGKLDEVVNKRTEKLRLELEQIKADFAKTKDENESLDKQWKDRYSKKVIETELRKEAEKAGVIPAAIDDVIFRASGTFSLDNDYNIEARDKDGNLVTVKKKPLDPALFMEQLKEKAPHFWPASKGIGATGGAGNGDASGVNPFMPGKHFNRTEQGRLMNQNPEKAQRLKAVADAAIEASKQH